MDGSELYERLCKRFGKPDEGSITAAFYLKLAAIVDIQGDRALVIIRSAAADSVGKGTPVRYFAKVAKLRLMEAGILDAGGL